MATKKGPTCFKKFILFLSCRDDNFRRHQGLGQFFIQLDGGDPVLNNLGTRSSSSGDKGSFWWVLQ